MITDTSNIDDVLSKQPEDAMYSNTMEDCYMVTVRHRSRRVSLVNPLKTKPNVL